MIDAGAVCVVSTTCASEEDAARLARILLDARLAACVQILPIRSFYSWQGQIRDEPEALLLIKARRDDWLALEAAVRAAHAYEIPEILIFEVHAGHAPYLDWVVAATARKRDGE